MDLKSLYVFICLETSFLDLFFNQIDSFRDFRTMNFLGTLSFIAALSSVTNQFHISLTSETGLSISSTLDM